MGGGGGSSGNSVSGPGRKVEGADVAVRLTDESRGINIDAEGSAVAKKGPEPKREWLLCYDWRSAPEETGRCKKYDLQDYLQSD